MLNESRFVNEFSLWASISPVIAGQQMGECEIGKEEQIRGKRGVPILQSLNNHCLIFLFVLFGFGCSFFSAYQE